MAADSSFDGAIFDSPKSSKLTMQEKRELVYEISKSHGASETLQSWSRQDILQVLCAEMGKERKYTGLTKQKIIEHLLRLISEKKSSVPDVLKNLEPQSPAGGHKNTKRQRKSEHLAQLSVPANDFPTSSSHNDLGHMACCKNLACRATLSPEDAFCRRCSCCICRQYDDNKDPSLWISCSAEPPFQGDSCNMSCHLECALKDERSGISKAGRSRGIDGSFYCVSCGKLNDLLGCCRKQLVHAKDTRRVDILCYRVSLSQKLLHRTEKYKVLYQIVDESVRKLEAEVGPIAGVPVKMGRGIVNRLSSGPEVQKLCASAIELLDSMISSNSLHLSPNPDIQDANFVPANMVRFEDVQSTSLTLVLSCENGSSENQVGFTLWHRKADDADYPAEPTCILRQPKARCAVMGLSPATKYHFKIVRNAIEWHQYDPTKWSIWMWKQMGLAYDLKQFRSNEIEKGRLQQQQKKLDQKRSKLDWGVPLEQLPVMEWDDYVDQAKNGRGLIAVAGVVHDVTDFINDHPGGKAMIKSGIGKDATAMFNGGVYYHSNAAHNLLSTMRVGVIRGGMEVEIWKRAHGENKDFIKDAAGNRIVRAGAQVTKVVEPPASAGTA